HGGVGIQAAGQISGNVTVEAGTGGVLLQGGLGSTAHALIGHGGYHITNNITGNVRVEAKGTGAGDGVRLLGGNGNHSYGSSALNRSGFSAALIGSGGARLTGSITGDTVVNVANGGMTLQGGAGYYSHAHVGHAGQGAGGQFQGEVGVDIALGDLLMEAGSA